MKKYRIIEDGNGKFRVEKLFRFLFWKFWLSYNPCVEATKECETINYEYYCWINARCFHKKYNETILFDSESEAKEVIKELNYKGHTIQKFYIVDKKYYFIDKKPVYLDLNCKMFWNYYRFGRNIQEVCDKIDIANDMLIKENERKIQIEEEKRKSLEIRQIINV